MTSQQPSQDNPNRDNPDRNSSDRDSWKEWSRYVLKELERLNTSYERISGELSMVHTEIATLKVKASLWGALGASIPVLIGIGIQILLR